MISLRGLPSILRPLAGRSPEALLIPYYIRMKLRRSGTTATFAERKWGLSVTALHFTGVSFDLVVQRRSNVQMPHTLRIHLLLEVTAIFGFLYKIRGEALCLLPIPKIPAPIRRSPPLLPTTDCP